MKYRSRRIRPTKKPAKKGGASGTIIYGGIPITFDTPSVISEKCNAPIGGLSYPYDPVEPAVPSDPTKGELTYVIKSFMRFGCVYTLLDSLMKHCMAAPVIIVDDSIDSSPDISRFIERGMDIQVVRIPADSGLSAGRNEALRWVQTPYFVLLDDDYIAGPKTDFRAGLDLIKESNLDILGGIVKNSAGKEVMYVNTIKRDREKGGDVIKMSLINSSVVDKEIRERGWVAADLIFNFFIAKTEAVRKHPWNDRLKIGEHSAFFIDHLNSLKVGYCRKFEIEHAQVRTEEYKVFRFRKNYLQLWLNESGIKRYSSGKVTYKRKPVERARIDEATAIKNLIDLRNILDEHKAVHWLSNGTLLGQARESGIIPHDEDTDICVMAKHATSDLIASVREAGFDVYKVCGELDDGLGITFTRNGVRTDFFFVYEKEKDGEIKWYHSVFSKFSSDGSEKHDFVFDPFSTRKGRLYGKEFNIPENTEEVLIAQYGKNWREPVKKWSYHSSPFNVVHTGERTSVSATRESSKILGIDYDKDCTIKRRK